MRCVTMRCSSLFYLVVFSWVLHSILTESVASVVLERACEVYGDPGTYLANQGEKKQLRCSWNGTDNVRTFTWLLNGRTFVPDPDLEVTREKYQTIKILEIDDGHAGNYSCTVKSERNHTSTAKLSLLLQGSVPSISSSPTDAVSGSNVTLTCDHSISNVTRILWFEGGTSLYGLHRSWVTFSGDGQYSESITIDLSKKNTDDPEEYHCAVTSQHFCRQAAPRPQPYSNEKRSDPFPLSLKYPIELQLTTTQREITLSRNEDFNINCSASRGDQPVSIRWYKDGKSVDQIDTLEVVVMGSGRMLRIYRAKPYHAGVYSCAGWNQYGTDNKTLTIDVMDESNDGNNERKSLHMLSGTPGVGSTAELMCVDNWIDLDIHNVDWIKDGKKLSKPHNRYVYNENYLKIPSLRKSDSGVFACRYQDKNRRGVYFNSTEFQLDVVDVPPKPTNLTVLPNSTTDNSLTIGWSYSTEHSTTATSVKILADVANLKEENLDTRVENTIPCEDEICPTEYTLRGLKPGTVYKIHVISKNSFGQTASDRLIHETEWSQGQELSDKSPDEYMVKVVVGVVAGCLVLFFALGYVFFRRHKKDYKKKVYDKIERELGVTLTKTLKPDPYEYPYDNLKFTGTLGEGAFGKVRKAEAPGLKGLNSFQCQQVVAVKMCRDDAGNEVDRLELLSEIEMLMKLGVHQHIIPLLGACTKRGAPTCLITQYMPEGDLQNYLRVSRPAFVGTYPFRPQTADSFQVTNINKMSNLCTSDDSLTSKDLISFARQIACGMEYVAAQKVVHRDLAARNVLVASKRSLKITDFGLAREMRGVNEEYVMGPNRKVPYRWLAPESFFDKKFTMHSDVWAYGILLYEILTLGGSPYPRHSIRDIPEMLKKGYRMSPPTNSKPELNQLMALCWNQTPECRPSFTEIKNLLDELLGDRPDEYLDCGDPDADILPNINSNDNNEVQSDNLFRYSFAKRGDVLSLAVQGYDRIADAHSAYNTLDTAVLLPDRLSEIKSNPIPDTYQHLPVVEPSPGSSRKDSAQYMNHETGMSPVLVKPDFVCQAENFLAQKL